MDSHDAGQYGGAARSTGCRGGRIAAGIHAVQDLVARRQSPGLAVGWRQVEGMEAWGREGLLVFVAIVQGYWSWSPSSAW
jgi:hypothetical protein